jgi:hypothetical protein
LNVSLSGWLCSCIKWEVQNTWMLWLEVVGGICSPQPLPRCWLILLAMGTPDSPAAHRTCTVQCPVRATSARLLGFRAIWPLESLSCSCTGQSGATPDMSGDLWLLHGTVHHCSLLQSTVDAQQPLLHWLTGHVRCTSDSLVNYSRARLANSQEWLVHLRLGLVHTGQCPVRHLAAHSCLAPNLIMPPSEFISWFVLNLIHLR